MADLSALPAELQTIPWSSFDPDTSKIHAENVEASREVALEALVRIDELQTPDGTVERRVLVTWQ